MTTDEPDGDIVAYEAEPQATPTPVNPVHIQATNWRHAFMLIAAAFLIQTCIFAYYIWSNTTHQNESDAVTACRAKLATNVTAAQVEVTLAANQNDAAFDDLVLALFDRQQVANDPETAVRLKDSLVAARDGLTAAGGKLVVAVEARVAFEEHPTSHC